MCMNRLYTIISELLSDTKELARMSATIREAEIQSRYIDQYAYPIRVSIVELKRDPAKSLKEHLAAAFIKSLYIDNEWEKEALDEMSKDAWEGYLKDVWIPEYFVHYDQFKEMKQYTSKEALEIVLDYLLEGGLTDSECELIIKQYEDMEIVTINDGVMDYAFVGVNDQYFIYLECGMYD